jgi:hypothetical protein
VSAATRIAALPSPARRAIALGLLMLALLVAWAGIVMPVRALILSQGEWREATARQIARDRGIAKTATQVHEAMAAVEASPLRARLYESAANSPAVELQNDLRAALVAAGVEPTNFKDLPALSTRGLRVHRVEFATMLSVDQLQAFLLALDHQARYVRIERLRLDAPAVQRGDENPRINALIEARGYSVDAAAAAPTMRVARAN